jgi:O-antigen ligase
MSARGGGAGLGLWAGAGAATLHHAGALKSLPGLAGLPFDLTLVAALLALPAAALLLLDRRWALAPGLAWPLLAAPGLLLWLVLAGTWSPSVQAGPEKLLAAVLMGPAMLGLGLVVGGEAAARRGLAATSLGLGLLAGAAVAWGVATDRVVLGGEVGADPDRVRVQYQITGLLIAAAGGLAAVRAVEARGWPGRLLWLCISGLCAAAVLVPGGRQGLFGLVAAVTAAPALRLWLAGRGRAALLWAGGLAGLALAALLVLLLDPEAARGFRTLERLTGEPGTVTVARVLLWGEAVHWADLAAPFGLGTGGFTIAAGFGEDRGLYPHNHALEMLAEGGLPGFALWTLSFGGGVALALRRAGRVAPGRAARLAALCLPVLLAIMVSTDLGNRMAWFVLGLLLSLGVEARPRGGRQRGASHV